MSRRPELERILQAWFEWESCSPDEKNQFRSDRYRDFRSLKEKEIKAKLSRLR
jgi:hypothetical protein